MPQGKVPTSARYFLPLLAHAQGTGFFALQSCANHSCAPNAATEGEADGRVAVYALRRIKAGEEVTLSYIEEGEDAGGAMSYKERQVCG